MKRIFAAARVLRAARNTNGRVKLWRSNATGANGRRAQSVSHNGILYTSGITTTDLDADITGQTQDVIHIIDNILARNGIDKTRVLTAAITLADMADYGAFNAVWDAWVVDGYEPARSVTGGQLAVPEYKIKISVTAAL